MADPTNAARTGAIRRFAAGLRFPQLFAVLAVLFVADMFVPDMIPFIDEIVLGLSTALLGMWKQRRAEIKTAGENEASTSSKPDEPMKSARPTD